MKKQDLSYVAFGQVFLDILKRENGEDVIHLEELEKVKLYGLPTTFFIRHEMFSWDDWFSTQERLNSLYTIWNFISNNPKHTFIVATGQIKMLMQILKKHTIAIPQNMRITVLYTNLKDLRSKIGLMYKITERFMVLPYYTEEKVEEHIKEK